MNDRVKAGPLLIIDGYGFVFRAYHVQPPLVSPDGQPVGAIYGFVSMLLKLINDFKPEYAVVALDSKGKNFRHELYKEYKSHRPSAPEDLLSQLPLVKSVAEALNFCVLEKAGVEADDIIATLATACSDENQEVIIISSDKDLLQLMDDKVKIYDPVKSKFILKSDVLAKYGVLPDKIREVQALMGDASDNIPGVRGIGPKTASELVNNFGSLEGVYASLDQIKSVRQQELLKTDKTLAFLSWQLVGLDRQVDVPRDLASFVWQAPEADKITKFILKYGFRSLGKRIESLFNVKIEKGAETSISRSLKPVYSSEQKVLITSEAELSKLTTLIEREGIIGVAFDKGISSINVLFAVKGKIHLLDYQLQEPQQGADLFSWSPAAVVSFAHNDFIDRIFADYSIKKITAGLKTLHKNFSNPLNSFEDLELMDYCLSAGQTRKSLSEIISHYTGEEVEEAAGKELAKYFVECYKILHNQLFKQKCLHLYGAVDLPLCRILHHMEKEGIKIDIPYLKKLSIEFQGEIKVLEQEIFKLCGEEFNIASPKQLGEILFDKLKLPFSTVLTKSKSYNTGAEILEKLSEAGHIVAELVLRYRQLAKLKNTYTDTLPKQADPLNHRIHTTFLQSSTTTGRLSSQDPNVQNIPIRTPEGNSIRAAFIAREGFQLISADYSQIELRILSHVADVVPLKAAFAKGEDVHTHTATQIFEVDAGEVTPDLRRHAKAINFGIIYGISSFGLAKNLNISKKAAADYIEKYFREYPGIQKYMSDTIDFARHNKYVANLLGRKCYIPLINHRSHSLRSFAERAAINAPMQSLTSDIAKMAMISIDRKLRAESLNTKMILQIHDELIFEAPEVEVEQSARLIKSIMENIITLDVPLKAEVAHGSNWQEI